MNYPLLSKLVPVVYQILSHVECGECEIINDVCSVNIIPVAETSFSCLVELDLQLADKNICYMQNQLITLHLSCFILYEFFKTSTSAPLSELGHMRK